MPVLDAAAMVALLRDEPGASEVADLLEAGGCAMSPVNLVEVVHRVSRSLGIGSGLVMESLLAMVGDGLEVVACDLDIGLLAGVVRADHYDRTDLPVSLADCVALATAQRRADRLVTSDAHLVRLAGRLEVATHPIPNSSGRRPAPEAG